MKPGFWSIAAAAVLMVLGVALYFSASGFLNVFVIPLLKGLSPEQAGQLIMIVLVVISFIAALIGGFFSVFLFEMAGGGYRPLLMGFLFALPAALLQIYVVIIGEMPAEMAVVYILESVMILLAFIIAAFSGRMVFRRFFSAETSPS